MLKILAELNAEGHTVILVTHDAAVAAKARRIIEISDGVITADRTVAEGPPVPPPTAAKPTGSAIRVVLDRFGESVRMALKAMASHRLRTALT
ncbi:hypothetical protein J8J27_25365, partial [Mycobacterium tuberculosis]|nr:hypothetical protein [Mycobacterium tuberculosis]